MKTDLWIHGCSAGEQWEDVVCIENFSWVKHKHNDKKKQIK